MPTLWKAGMIILVVCLLASMAIAIVRLATTPEEIFGTGFRIHHHQVQEKQPPQP
jgi:hypothetical protein